MPRRITYYLLIVLGIVLLFSSIIYWLDIKTSEKPVGLGQNILGWAAVVIDTLTWITVYLVNKKDNSDTGNNKSSKHVFINGDVINSNLNIGDNGEIIISKDENGNTDYRQSISNAYRYLDSVKTEFDRENVIFARRLLDNVKDIITALKDESLSLEYEILECRCI